jgi:ABC-type sugar transport system ATPase subunit
VTAREPILAFSGIAKAYGKTHVLAGVDLRVEAGAFTVIYGLPAAGKSVLMRILMGLEKADAGSIVLRGRDVSDVPAADRNIGYVPQSFALYPNLSVRDNIAYPLTLTGVGRDAAEPIVQNAAEMLRITEHLGKRPDQLSGGQKQRVAIARGIAKRTDVFVLDDPLAGLDFKLREQLVEDLRLLQAETRATFLYTTSDIVEGMTLADAMAVLDEGVIVESGTPAALYDRPTRDRTMALVGFPPANFLLGELEQRDGTTVCVTDVFEAPVAATGSGPVRVGIRPEHIRVTPGPNANGHGARDGVALPATVVLREDLGGEEIVYLEAGTTMLTSVDRHELPIGDLSAVTASILPEHLALFDVMTGRRLGSDRASQGV